MSQASTNIQLRPSYDRAVVTGGGSGFGRAVALSLAESGVNVAVLGRTLQKLEETAEIAADLSGSILPIVCDIRDADQVDAAFTEFEAAGGPAQLLYQSAASLHVAFAIDITPADFAGLIQGSLTGAFHVIRRWALSLVATGLPGAGVAVTSCRSGRETPGIAHSAAAKSGLEAFVRTVAREWGQHGIRINAVGPGPFLTEGLAPTLGTDTVARRVAEATALGRFGEIQEIVGPSVFLLSDAASYITGEVIVVDGGRRLTPMDYFQVGDELRGDWTHLS